MATIVGGSGCSHSPQTSMPPQDWLPQGQWDIGRRDSGIRFAVWDAA
jgi:hypothetical protein